MPITDLTNTTWLLNLSPVYDQTISLQFNFTSNENTYTQFSYFETPFGNAITYDNTQVFLSDSSSPSPSPIPEPVEYGWVSDAYRTITITSNVNDPYFIAWLEANATQQVAPQPSASITIGNLLIDKAYFGNSEISAIYFGNVKVYESGPVIDPVFANNDWATIKSVAESGNASNYWNVGDTKTDTGTDTYTRTFRISDMSGLYGKHLVIEEVNVEGTDGSGTTGVVWNAETNTDSDNCINNYSISDIRLYLQSTVLLRLSNDLQAVITNSTYKVAKNGNSTTVLELEDKLILPAEKEMGGTNYYAVSQETIALTTWNYYTTHTTASDRIKYNSSNTARYYWLRSSYAGGWNGVIIIGTTGSFTSYGANGTHRFSFFFAL